MSDIYKTFPQPENKRRIYLLRLRAPAGRFKCLFSYKERTNGGNKKD
jgi:hypothetical protein